MLPHEVRCGAHIVGFQEIKNSEVFPSVPLDGTEVRNEAVGKETSDVVHASQGFKQEGIPGELGDRFVKLASEPKDLDWREDLEPVVQEPSLLGAEICDDILLDLERRLRGFQQARSSYGGGRSERKHQGFREYG